LGHLITTTPFRVLKHQAHLSNVHSATQVSEGNEMRISVYCIFPPDIAIPSNLYHCTVFMVQVLGKRPRNAFCIAAAEKETARKKTIMIKLSKSANIFTGEQSLQQWRVQGGRVSALVTSTEQQCTQHYNMLLLLRPRLATTCIAGKCLATHVQ
jgi:hypothetical protein